MPHLHATLRHWDYVDESLVGDEEFYASVASTGLSFLLVSKEGIHEKILVNSLVAKHSVAC